jgi:RNA polymerase sigma-B factor
VHGGTRPPTSLRAPGNGPTPEALDRAEADRTIPRHRADPDERGDRSGPPAVDPEVWYLHVRFHRRRDTRARDLLVEEYQANARHLASRFYRHREPLDDLVQVAMEALLHALDRFDPGRRLPFLGFATPTIVGSLKRYYRDAGWLVRVPRRVHDLSGAIGAAVEVLTQDLGRAPRIGEIADLLDLSEIEVGDALGAFEARNVTSIDGPSPGSEGPLELAIGDDADLAVAEARVALGQAVELLERDEREVLHRYFLLELSQDQIAAQLGISQMQVSRMLGRVLKRLRGHLPP